LGILLAVIVVTYQDQFLGVDRPGSAYNPNVFARIVFVSGIVLLTATIYYHYSRWKKVLMIAGALAAIYSVMLAQSRGVLLATLPVSLVALTVLARFWRSESTREVVSMQRKNLIWILAGILIPLMVISYQHGVDVGDRYSTAITQLTEYAEGESRNTSVGVRLELWYSAWLSFKDSPLTGIGSENRKEYLKDLASRGIIDLEPRHWKNHAHNDYFDNLQRRGLPGMLFVIGLYGILFIIYWRALEGGTREQFALSLGGLLTVTAYATFSITAAPLWDSETLVFFTVLNAILLGMLGFTLEKKQ